MSTHSKGSPWRLSMNRKCIQSLALCLQSSGFTFLYISSFECELPFTFLWFLLLWLLDWWTLTYDVKQIYLFVHHPHNFSASLTQRICADVPQVPSWIPPTLSRGDRSLKFHPRGGGGGLWCWWSRWPSNTGLAQVIHLHLSLTHSLTTSLSLSFVMLSDFNALNYIFF